MVDSNKFGQKMLEKMGWSQGKGLGAKEDGIVEHVKQTFKNDAAGIGYVDKGDQWTKHEADFTSLLQSLGGDETDKTVPRAQIELEKRSQTSKKRVHYHKYLRGKDLSLRSEKDLAQIFGKKSLKETVTEIAEAASEPSEKNFGVVTVNGGNMRDYFGTKFGSAPALAIDRDSGDERPSFQMNDSLGFSGLQLESPVAKKKKRTKVVVNECFDNGGFVDFDAETPGKKRKLATITEEAEDDEATRKRKLKDDSDEQRKKKPKRDEPETKKRKKSKKSTETIEGIVKKQKKKARVVDGIGIDNPTCLSTEMIDDAERHGTSVSCNEVVRKKPKNDENVKKKKSKRTPATDENGIDNPTCLSTEIIDAVAEPTVSNEVVRKRPKQSIGLDNEACAATSNEVVRKRPKQSIGIDNEACTATSIEQRIQETIASVTEAVDEYQLELENQMNEGKEHEEKAEAIWKSLKPKRNFAVRKSVKHFITGEVRCKFDGSNLLKLAGYGNNVQRR